MNLNSAQIEAIRCVYVGVEVDCMTHNELVNFVYNTMIERLPHDEDALKAYICDASDAETWEQLVDMVTPDE